MTKSMQQILPPTEVDIAARRTINRLIVESGVMPTIDELASTLHIHRDDMVKSLHRLERDHRLLLYRDSDDIWVAHPFSATPSNYWVQSETLGWWGNCGFCSLGIAAMVGGDVSIHTHIGAERSPIQIDIEKGNVLSSDFSLHVPLPIADWHNNVVYTCGNVHYFNSDKSIGDWCERHHVPRGRSLPINDAWQLAQLWYGSYLNPDWKPLSNEDIRVVLKSCELNEAFWHL